MARFIAPASSATSPLPPVPLESAFVRVAGLVLVRQRPQLERGRVVVDGRRAAHVSDDRRQVHVDHVDTRRGGQLLEDRHGVR